MTTREERKKRTAMLKALRHEHEATVSATRAQLKEQQSLRRRLRQALADGALTVPELAEAAGLPMDQVLWHITAMRKYDEVVEAGLDGAYYRYALAQET